MATIQGVYVALFGRPADPIGLAYFNGVTNNGANLNAIGDLASTQEYKDRFAGQNNIQIITAIYQSLFNRDPEAAGLNFFVNALNTGSLSINNIAIAILDGAQGTDKTIVDAKIASANSFTAALDTPTEIGSYVGNTAAASGRAFLADVGTTPKTAAQADAAVAAIVTAGNTGKTDIALTGGNDLVNTTTTTAALKTTGLNDTITAAAGTYDPANDVIDGGFGVDTFKVTIGANTAILANGLKNVELAFVTATAGAAINVAEGKELTQVWNEASTAALTVDGIALTTTAGLKGTIVGLTTFNFASATGTADAAALALDGATAPGGVNVAGVETLTVANTGTSSVGLIDSASLKSVTVGGTGSLTANFGATVETITNSGAAKITTDLTGNNALKTYTGGTGVDAVTIDGVFSNDLTINLGAGADTISLTGAGVETKALTVTLGSGADIVTLADNLGNVQAVDTNANFIKTLITITDFNKAEDAIKLDTATPASDRETLLVAEQVQAEAAADLLAATTIIANTTDVGKFAVFAYKGDTYIFDNVAGAGLQAGDSLVKITGITPSDLTATTFEVF